MKRTPRYTYRDTVLNDSALTHWRRFAEAVRAFAADMGGARGPVAAGLLKVRALAVAGRDAPENPCHTLRGLIDGLISGRGPAVTADHLIYYSDLVLRACGAPAGSKAKSARKKAGRSQKGAGQQKAADLSPGRHSRTSGRRADIFD